MMRIALYLSLLLSLVFVPVASSAKAPAGAKAARLAAVKLRPAGVKKLGAKKGVLRKAKLLVTGAKLVAARGWKIMRISSGKAIVVRSETNVAQAAKVPMSAFLDIRDGETETLHLCSGASCPSCEFFFDTVAGGITCESPDCDGCRVQTLSATH